VIWSAKIAVKFAGICWVIKIGVRSETPLNSRNMLSNACGPPVEQAIASACVVLGRVSCRTGDEGTGIGSNNLEGAATCAPAGASLADDRCLWTHSAGHRLACGRIRPHMRCERLDFGNQVSDRNSPTSPASRGRGLWRYNPPRPSCNSAFRLISALRLVRVEAMITRVA
jgi:hypothetical protein